MTVGVTDNVGEGDNEGKKGKKQAMKHEWKNHGHGQWWGIACGSRRRQGRGEQWGKGTIIIMSNAKKNKAKYRMISPISGT